MVNTKGLNWNAKPYGTDSALHIACLNDRQEVVRFLLTLEEVNVNITDNDGKSPLHCACSAGHLEIIHLLSAVTEIKMNIKDDSGDTPLHHACKNGRLEIVSFLSTLNEVSVNEQNYNGMTPLHSACENGHLEIVRLLSALKHVKIHDKDNNGNTPLHYACEKNRLDIARFLVEVGGADYSIQNNNYDTPIHKARQHSYFTNYLKKILNNPDFSLSRQRDRRLQFCREKPSNLIAVHPDDTFELLSNKILESGLITIEDMQTLAQCISTRQDASILCSLAKGINTMGIITPEEYVQALDNMFIRILDENLSLLNHDYIYIKRLLKCMKTKRLISENNYLHWIQQLRAMNLENSSKRIEGIIGNTAIINAHSSKYKQIHDHFEVLYNAYINKKQDEIAMSLLRIGVSILRLIPNVPEMSEIIDYTIDISNLLEFCRFVFEEEELDAYLDNGNGELVLKPAVYKILTKSNIKQITFTYVLKDLLSECMHQGNFNKGNKLSIKQIFDDIRPTLGEKNGNYNNSILGDTISEVSSTQDGGKNVFYEPTITMDLISLCKALKGKIVEGDFMNEMVNYHYITALHYSEGDVSLYERTINFIPSQYSVNETAKLCIKREGSKDIYTKITAVQYAAICGYADILEKFFLPTDQADGIDFGLDSPVSYYGFASKQQKL